jgi:hypothetical protein
MYLETRNVVKFGVLVGFTAIFLAASIAHGLFWEHNLDWTSWIAGIFLITTIFTRGTACLGAGFRQGLVPTTMPIASVLDGPMPTVAQLWAKATWKEC